MLFSTTCHTHLHFFVLFRINSSIIIFHIQINISLCKFWRRILDCALERILLFFIRGSKWKSKGILKPYMETRCRARFKMQMTLRHSVICTLQLCHALLLDRSFPLLSRKTFHYNFISSHIIQLFYSSGLLILFQSGNSRWCCETQNSKFVGHSWHFSRIVGVPLQWHVSDIKVILNRWKEKVSKFWFESPFINLTYLITSGMESLDRSTNLFGLDVQASLKLTLCDFGDRPTHFQQLQSGQELCQSFTVWLLMYITSWSPAGFKFSNKLESNLLNKTLFFMVLWTILDESHSWRCGQR